MENTKYTTRLSKTGYPISSQLYGIFLEDINFACDGGLNANKVNNYSFDGVYFDNEKLVSVSDPLRYWTVTGGSMKSCADAPLSENSRFARITVTDSSVLSNLGYNGLQSHREACAMSIESGHTYRFSCMLRADQFEGAFTVHVTDEAGYALTDTVSPVREAAASASGWYKYSCTLKGTAECYGKLLLTFTGHGTADLDCVIFRDEDIWGKDDPKWRHGTFRRDLVEALDRLHPKFMRFPGGCIVEGTLPGNEYNWKDTVGELYERKSNYCLWSEKIADGGYNQSYQIGFYEYFCLCEDLGMKPQPTLTVGLNCQIRSSMRNETECPNIPIDSPEFETQVIANYLDLIDFANGDPKTNPWAALRAKMGHPASFGLDRIGIGNENYGTTYLERFDRIEKAIHEKAPDMLCIMCGGIHPFRGEMMGIPGLDFVWDYANKHHPDVLVDEHSYHTPEWFIEQESRFDNYERGKAKVYFGEYAANSMLADAMRPMNLSNQLDTALGEAVFLTGIERNGDVVEMTSYAPLFNLIDCDQWNHNLINFNPKAVCLTTNYYVQELFSNYVGNTYLPHDSTLPDRVYLSATADAEYLYLKLVNAGAQDHLLEIQTGALAQNAESHTLHSDTLSARNELEFYGDTRYHIQPTSETIAVDNGTIDLTVKKYSVQVLKLKK